MKDPAPGRTLHATLVAALADGPGAGRAEAEEVKDMPGHRLRNPASPRLTRRSGSGRISQTVHDLARLPESSQTDCFLHRFRHVFRGRHRLRGLPECPIYC